MNNSDELKNSTLALGYIGEYAGVSRFSAVLNKMFKKNDKNMMIIPMNIREDDFYFTVANMKKSQVDGAYIDAEFQKSVLDLLDFRDEMVEVYAKCDFVVRENGNLKGYLLEKNDVKTQEEFANIVFDKFIKG
jgi:shikimate 5-dehydrogenase